MSPDPAVAPVPLRAHVWFVVAATVSLAMLAWYLAAGGLPWLMPLSTQELFQRAPRWVGPAFKLWMTTAAILTLALPFLALIAWGRHRSVRQALLPYALVLVAQIATESALSRRGVPRAVVVTGLLYTSYRLWQLVRARAAFAAVPAPTGFARRAVGFLLLAGLVFWSANLLILLALMAGRTVGVLSATPP
jgi:hypothetical protein